MANYLFVHQNFPGQFPHLVNALIGRGHRVVAIGETGRLTQRGKIHPGLSLAGYPQPKGAGAQTHHYLRGMEAHVRRGQSVFKAAQSLLAQGFRPDVVISHPGWGESLFLKDAFPQARHIHYLEYFYRAQGGDVGFDPAFPATVDDVCRIRIKSATQLVGLEYADAGLSPTAWQKSTYPEFWQPRITQIHDGIDTGLVRPDDAAGLALNPVADQQGLHSLADSSADSALVLSAKDEILTYVARNLEPYRGFHVFMRALPRLLELRPLLRVLIVGGDQVSYGRQPDKADTWRQQCLQEWNGNVDLSRVHFLGKLPYAQYLKVLQLSSLHLYLTYPFVLSWSLLEAMSAGCLVLGSGTAPVREVITHGHNGMLCDFFDIGALAAQAAVLLGNRHDFAAIRSAARQTVRDHYDLHSQCLPAQLAFLSSFTNARG